MHRDYPLQVVVIAIFISLLVGFMCGKFNKDNIILNNKEVEYEARSHETFSSENRLSLEDHSIKVEKVIVYETSHTPAMGITPMVAEERTTTTFSNIHDFSTDIAQSISNQQVKSTEKQKQQVVVRSSPYHLSIAAILPVTKLLKGPTSKDIQIVLGASYDLFWGFSAISSFNMQKYELGVGLQWSW